jgi:hypothetical protein
MKDLTVYFSNFGFSGKHEKAVSIARKSPKGFSGLCIPEFAPSWNDIQEFRKTGDELRFITKYYDIVHEINIERMDEILDSINGKILMCYCSGDDFCHRYLLAKILEYNFEAKIIPLGFPWPDIFTNKFEKIDTFLSWPDGVDYRDYYYLAKGYKGIYSIDYKPSQEAIDSIWQ